MMKNRNVELVVERIDKIAKASIERNSTFCIYVEQPLHDVTFIEKN